MTARLGVTEPQGRMTEGSLEGGVTHPYDTGSSALGLRRASLLQMRVLSQFVSNGSTSYKTTLANTHHSLGTRPRQDYTHCVMLNDCVSARWSPMYQYLALTSLRDSHRLPTRHIREPGNVRRLFFSLPYFRFRTSISVLRFPFQRFPLAQETFSEEVQKEANQLPSCTKEMLSQPQRQYKLMAQTPMNAVSAMGLTLRMLSMAMAVSGFGSMRTMSPQGLCV